MTSTKFNIGFGESKNSSRVLKPPGGGHSDIFGAGAGEGNETQMHGKRRTFPQSSINSCFMHEEATKPTNAKDELTEKNDITNGNQNGKTVVMDENSAPKEVDETSVEEKVQQKEKETAEPLRRTRVPPGGYSSGFW